MERLGPEFLRKYAAALEDERRLENVESLRRCPTLDQDLILALNRKKTEKTLPTAGTVMNWLKERLISVSTNDGQSAILGLFYTKLNYLTRCRYEGYYPYYPPKVVAAIFPLYKQEIKYTIRPLAPVYTGWSRVPFLEEGGIMLTQETLDEKDPVLISNQKGFNFLCYKKSPFTPHNPYQMKLPDREEPYSYLLNSKKHELALEENLIKGSLWYVARKRRPRLFKQKGFAKFINSHCSDPKYVELHAAFTQSRIRAR